MAKEAARETARAAAKDVAKTVAEEASKDSAKAAAKAAAKEAVEKGAKETAEKAAKSSAKSGFAASAKKAAARAIKLAALVAVGDLAYLAYSKYDAKNASFPITGIDPDKSDSGAMLITYTNTDKDAKMTGGESLVLTVTNSVPTVDATFIVPDQTDNGLPINQVLLALPEGVTLTHNGTSGNMKCATDYDDEFLKTAGDDADKLLNGSKNSLCKLLGVCGMNFKNIIWYFAAFMAVVVFLVVGLKLI